MIRLPDASALGPTPNANSGRAVASVDLTGVGRGLQQLGAGIQDAAGNMLDLAKEDQFRQARIDANRERKQWFKATTDLSTANQGLENDFEDRKTSASADGAGFQKDWMGVVAQRQKDFLATVPPEMQERVKPLLDLQRSKWEGVAAKEERALGTKYTAGVIWQDYENYRKQINQDPNSRADAEKVLNERIDQAPYFDAATKADMKLKARNGIEITQWQALYGKDPDGGARAFGRGQNGGDGSPDATWNAMLQKENASGDPSAVSPKGALGVSQVMPDTAREVAGKLGMADVAKMDDKQLHAYFAANPEANHKIGRAYFNEQLSKYGGDQEAAVIAYNGGPGVADKWLSSGRDDSVLPKETQDDKATVLKNSGADAEEESPDNFPDASGATPHSATPGTVGLMRYLAPGKGGEHITGMQKPLQSGLQSMFDAAPPEVKQYLSIMSGYRSPERQKQLWDAAVAKYGSAAAARKWVAPPGNSQHNHGNAADLSFDGAGTTAKLSPNGRAAMEWVHANAGKFGLAFPLSNEPWHAELAGARGGGAPAADPRFSTITLDQQNTLLRQAGEGQVKDKGEVTSLMKDDLASMEMTGRGVSSLTPDRVRGALGDDAVNAWIRQRQLAQSFHDATADFDSLPDALIPQRLASLAPAPGQEGFIDAQKTYVRAQQLADATLQNRYKDPAGSVMAMPEVAKASEGANLSTPSSYAPLVQARMQAQTRLGIPDAMQSPMTLDEAQRFLAPINKAIPGQEKAVMRQVMTTLGEVYGPHADQALAYMMAQGKVDKETQGIAATLFRKLGLGQPITRDDARAFDDAQKLDASNNAVAGVLGPNQGSFPTPDMGAIGMLRSNSSLASQFDQVYGAGRAAQILSFQPPAPPVAAPEPPDAWKVEQQQKDSAARKQLGDLYGGILPPNTQPSAGEPPAVGKSDVPTSGADAFNQARQQFQDRQ